jgi:hypothetical protein
MLDPREQLKGGFRAFAQRDAERREHRDAAPAAAGDTATSGASAPDAPATPATSDAPAYGPRLVKDVGAP